MSERLTIQITAQDGTSRTFSAISSGATRMGDAVENAGKDGARGMDQLGTSARKNATALEQMKAEATAIGTVMGTVFTGVSLAGQAFRDQERQIGGITRLYGESSTAILQMAEDMQSLTRYSNDAAREGALTASSLSTNYGLAADDIATLVERSADLAQVFGTDLQDAVQRTSSAIRGEGEAAERLGLNMSDAAVAARALDAGITNWGVPGALTEAEKAAFRFQVFLEDTEATVGAAGEAAAGAGGGFREFANEAQDAVQSVGDFLGPIGEVAAEMAPIALYAPLAGAAIGRLSQSLGQSVIAARAGSGAMVALRAATSPVGLALTALGLAGLYAWNVFREGREASQGLEDALVSLGDVAESLRLGHRDVEAGFVDEFRADTQAISGMAEEYASSERLRAMATEEYESQVRELGQYLATDHYTILEGLQSRYRLGTDEQKAFAAAQVEVGRMFANTSVDASLLDNWLDRLDARYQANEITFDQYTAGIIWATENQDRFRAATEGAAAAGEDNAAALAQQQAEADALAQSMQEVLDRLLAVAGVDDPLSQWNLSGSASEAAQLANSVTDAGMALDTVFRVVVGNTDAFAQQTQAVSDWADELIGAVGTYAVIDDLLGAGVITLEQYNAAQQAQIEIAEANASVQQNVQAIQANMAPLIAEHTTALAAQLDLIRQMPADQQLIALGWMDAATAGRAMEFQTLAVAAASGELGAAGEGAFTSMITGAAQADPVLKALLVDMGLITEHPDGTFTVNLDGADAAMSDMDQLTIAILNLQALMGDQSAYEIAVEIYGKEEADKLFGDLAAEDGKTRTTTIQANVQVGDGTGGAGGRTVEQIVRDAFGEDVIPVEPEVEVTPIVRVSTPEKPLGEDFQRMLVGEESIRLDVPIDLVPVATVAEDALGAAQDVLTAAFGGMGGDGAGVTIPINAQDNASPTLQFVSDQANSLDGRQTSMTIAANDAASAVIGAAQGALAGAQGATATMQIDGNNAGAMGAIGAVAAYNGSVLATSYIDIVTRNYQQNILMPRGNRRHGGIAGYAEGGIVAELAEAGSERLHFAGGGTAIVHDRGLYNVPEHTYVSPHNAASNTYGAPNITIVNEFKGPVFGMDDLHEQTLKAIGPAIAQAMAQYDRGMGAS